MQGTFKEQSIEPYAAVLERAGIYRGSFFGITTPPNTDVFLQQMAPDQVVLLLVQDNIELACRAIEKAAMDRAVADVDENFAASYELRRRHRQVLAMSRLLLR